MSDFDARLENLQQVLNNIKAQAEAVQKKVKAALTRGALLVQRESQLIVPVQTGNLKAGAFTRVETSSGVITATVGYVAAYAIYVHENLEAAHGEEFNRKHADQIEKYGGAKSRHPFYFYRGPNQKARFLSIAYENNVRSIMSNLEAAVKSAVS